MLSTEFCWVSLSDAIYKLQYAVVAAAAAAATWQAADAAVDAIVSWRHHWSLTDSPSNCQYFHSTVSAAQHPQLISRSSFVCSVCSIRNISGISIQCAFNHMPWCLLMACFRLIFLLPGNLEFLGDFSPPVSGSLLPYHSLIYSTDLDSSSSSHD